MATDSLGLSGELKVFRSVRLYVDVHPDITNIIIANDRRIKMRCFIVLYLMNGVGSLVLSVCYSQ